MHAEWVDIRAIELAVEQGGDWSKDTELLAVLVEVLDGLRVNHYVANSKKGTKAPKPLSVPRPYESKGST